MKDLGSRSRSALTWNFLGNGFRVAAQFLIGIVLARLLGPKPFGIVAVAWLVIGVANLVADMGFGSALVQRAELHERDVRFVFWAQIGVGILLALMGLSVAGPIAHFFSAPEAITALRAMMSIFILQALGQASSALLRRELNFKAVQLAAAVSYLGGYLLVGIPLAVLKYGYWSLVSAQILQSGLNAAILLVLARPQLKPAFTPHSHGLFSFGSKIIGANILSWSIGNLDSLVIGRFIGVVDLGLYNRVMAIVSIPINGVVNNVQTVLFAASARAQSDMVRVKRAFLVSASGVGSLCIPVFITVAAVPHTLILGIYGTKWTAAVVLARPLALAMIVHSIACLIGPSLEATNNATKEIHMQFVTVAIMVPLILVLARFSTEAVAWGVCAIYVLRFVLLMAALMAVADIALEEVVSRLVGPFLIGAVALSGVALAEVFGAGLRPTVQLILDAGGAGLMLAISLAMIRIPVIRDTVGRYVLVDLPLPQIAMRLLGRGALP